MTETQNNAAPVKAVLFGLDLGEYDMEKSMEELAALAEAAGMQAVAEVVQKRAVPEAATYLGEGRLAEGKLLCQNLEAQCAIFDAELSGSQIRNLEEFLQVEVMDRTMLILEIFARRAVTNEGKLQTELALLRYRLPRLAGLGAKPVRVRAAAVAAGRARGAAQVKRKLEYDRRHVRRRIEALSERLAEVSRRREQARSSRQKSGVPVIALVGYTNVGKSSLLNRMCGAGVLEADMLFATLDPTARQLTLPAGLPAWRWTQWALSAACPTIWWRRSKHAGRGRLCRCAGARVRRVRPGKRPPACGDGRSAGKPWLRRHPHCHRIQQMRQGARRRAPDDSSLRTSAATGEGVDALLARLDALLASRVRRIRVLLPYDKLGEASPMRQRGTVLAEEYRPDGVYLEGIVKAADVHRFQPWLLPNE